MERKIALTNGTIYSGTEVLSNSALLVRGKYIYAIVEDVAIPADYECIDLRGKNLCAGLIDLQIYGWGNHLFSSDLTEASLVRIEDSLLRQGTTSFYLTLATNEIAVFKEAIKVFKSHQVRNSLGLHLEGPFLNAAKRGAHPAEFIFSPTVEDLEDLLDDAGDVVQMMTVAPELLSDDALAYLQAKNILLSAGHSSATFAEATAAFGKGIKTVTHLWNAMSALHHRAGGLPTAVFNHPSVTASIVVDGIHVDFEVVKLSKFLLGERLILITDAVAACDKGIYKHVLNGDHYTLPDGTLSGSALTLLKAIQNCVEHVGMSLDEAIRMATLYPARLIGRKDLGQLKAGCIANLLIFSDDFQTEGVYFEGEYVN